MFRHALRASRLCSAPRARVVWKNVRLCSSTVTKKSNEEVIDIIKEDTELIQEGERIKEELKKAGKTKFLSKLDNDREPIKPVAKEMFCGRVDHKVMTYPDVLRNDRYIINYNVPTWYISYLNNYYVGRYLFYTERRYWVCQCHLVI